ncbi:MAG: protein translocase subunit SecF [Candidatus Melainabacteria bacterium]
MTSPAKTAAKPAATDPLTIDHGLLDVVKQRTLYIVISLLLLLPGVFFIAKNMTDPAIQAPVHLGIDFTGGSMLQYGFEKTVTVEDLSDIRDVFEKKGYTGTVVQVANPVAGINQKPIEIGEKTAATEAGAFEVEAPTPQSAVKSIVSIRSKQLKEADMPDLEASLSQKYGHLTLLEKSSVGPSLASELLTNGLIALLLAYVLIVGYLTFRFEFDFAVCAVIALVHDALFVFGIFAMMGSLFHTEVNSMFVTAILTVVGFSVHDTIVVFDRVRENYRIHYTKKVPFATIANLSVNQTLARSINTSVSALLPLIALWLFGGETTKDFVFATILGIGVGTFSSIFVASMLLTWWRERHIPQAGSPARTATTSA